MLNLSNVLNEAANAPISYPDLYKPKQVWKIREDNGSNGWGRPENGYLTASFVLEKNLRWPDLGFNLTVQVMNGGRTLQFLSEDDARRFLKMAEANYPSLSNYNLIVAKGRGGDDLVRVNTKIDLPIYISKNVIKWLSDLEDTKVPQEVRDRLNGQIQVSNDQKEKEEKQVLKQEQNLKFNENMIKAINQIDPTCEIRDNFGHLMVQFKKDNVKVNVGFDQDKVLKITRVIFPKGTLRLYEPGRSDDIKFDLMPDQEVIDRRYWTNSIVLEDDNSSGSIYYPQLRVRKDWDVDRLVKEINSYLDNIINRVNNFDSTEEFE